MQKDKDPSIEREVNSGNIPNEKELSTYVDLFTHWDDSYWTASYVFLLIQGVLIAALTHLRALTDDNSWLVIAFFFGLFGLAVFASMFFVLNRKITYTHGSEQCPKNLLKSLYDQIETEQTNWRKRYSSAESMQTCLPILFGAFWFAVAVVSIVKYLV